MRIERTSDEAVIRSIVGHPQVKALVTEDEVQVPIHESIYYIVGKEETFADGAAGDDLIGVVAFIPVNPVTWTPHIAVLPHHWGKGTELLQLAISWMQENTPCKKMFAAPPSFNARMIRVFIKLGFNREGFSPKSFLWCGELVGRVLMGKEI